MPHARTGDTLPPAFTVRQATPDDRVAVIHFIIDLADETERLDLVPATVSRGVRSIEDDDHAFTLLACDGEGNPIGVLIVGGTEFSTFSGGRRWWVTDVYVAPRMRRRGVLRALYQVARDLAESTPNVIGLRLCVYCTNLTAQEAYEELGFRPTKYIVLTDDFPVVGGPVRAALAS